LKSALLAGGELKTSAVNATRSPRKWSLVGFGSAGEIVAATWSPLLTISFGDFCWNGDCANYQV
jgi:hypothetical protein